MSESNRKSIKDWAEADRPREKLMQQGASALTESELLAIIIGSGNDTKSAVGLAQEILDYFENRLMLLGKASVHELIKHFKGVGEAKAISILAAVELGRRRREERADEFIIKKSEDVFRFMSCKFSDEIHEEFWVLYLSNSNKVLRYKLHTKGGMTETVVEVRTVLREAICIPGCTSIIACHNHPSGILKPSNSDDRMTEDLKKACDYMQIRFLDHVIIGERGYYSYKDSSTLL